MKKPLHKWENPLFFRENKLEGHNLALPYDARDKVEYGKSAVVPKTVPKKPSDEYYDYTFEGWDTTYDYTKVTANLSIAPKFKATLKPEYANAQ